MYKYKKLEWFINQIDKPRRKGCLKFYKEYKEYMLQTPASSNNHQAWPGGYIEHLEEIMNMGTVCYNALEQSMGRTHLFPLSSAYIAWFWHDVEKIFKYSSPRLNFIDEDAKFDFIWKYCELTDDETNAIKYMHGEGNDYTNKKRIMCELAAFCHAFDNISAREFYNHPKH